MPIPALPKTVSQTLHYYHYAPQPTKLVMFDTLISDNDPSWLHVFSVTIEIPVPEGTLEALYAGIEPRFEAAREKINLTAGKEIAALYRVKATLLAIEN